MKQAELFWQGNARDGAFQSAIPIQITESPQWDDRRGELAFVDVREGLVCAVNARTGTTRAVRMGRLMGAVCLAANGGYAALGQGGVFLLCDLTLDEAGARALKPLCNPAPAADERFNDAKCDPAGRILGGAINHVTKAPDTSSLIAIEPDGTCRTLFGGMALANGMGFSPDAKTFYHIDTRRRTILAYPYDAQAGAVGEPRLAVSLESPPLSPDGMTVDTDGMLWAALWGAGCVRRFEPFTGRLLDEVRLPCAQVSSCAFGGDDLRTLYITTARVGLSPDALAETPLAGAVFAVRTGAQGMPEYRFAGKTTTTV